MLGFLAVLLSLTGCVSKKKHEALQNQMQRDIDRAELNQKKLRAQLDELLDSKATLEDSITVLNARVERLEKDLIDEREAVLQFQEDYANLKSQSGKKILKLISDLEVSRQDIYNRELRLAEIKKQLEQRQTAADQLRDRIREQLLLFSDDLELDVREGNVYVKLANKLLFRSGEAKISDVGREALQELSKILQREKSLKVNVEGHTDNQSIARIRCIDDNWQLSVIRSTNVAKALVEFGVQPTRIIASGRSKYQPVATNDTESGRAKNRRTEIILIPDYADLLELLDENAPYKADPTEESNE